MKKLTYYFILASVFMFSGPGWAESTAVSKGTENTENRKAKKIQHDAMSTEERTAAREVKQAAFESMSAEERAATRERRKAVLEAMSPEERKSAREAAKTRFENMSPDERKAARSNHADKRGKGKRQGRERKH